MSEDVHRIVKYGALHIPLYFQPLSVAFELKVASCAHNSFAMPVFRNSSLRDSLNGFSWNLIFESLRTFLYILQIWLNLTDLSDLSSLVISCLKYRLLQGYPNCINSVTLLLIRAPTVSVHRWATVMMISFAGPGNMKYSYSRRQ